MKIYIQALLILFSSKVSAEISIKIHDSLARKTYDFALKTEPPADIERFHRSLLFSSAIANASMDDLHFIKQLTNVDGQEITRLTPLIDGLVVEGADAVYTKNEASHNFEYTYFTLPKASFKISSADALEVARKYQVHTDLKNPYIEKINGLYTEIWLMHFGELRPVYKTRLPTLNIFDLKDIYIDAETQEILKIEDSAFFAQAHARAFVYSPKSGFASSSELKDVILTNLVDVKEDGLLEGEYMQVKTCCKYYTCPNGGPCTDEEKKCALASHENALQKRELLELPTDSLGLDPLITLPKTISVDAVRCTYLPFARASLKRNNGQIVGFFDQPIDEVGTESEMDRFSEIQAYFSVMSFFNNIRSLLNDQSWCLRSSAMSCNADGSPKLENGRPTNPYRVFVNQMIPDMKLGSQQSDPENFLTQILGGRGSRENPIRLNSFSRMGNAAFVPALSQLKTTTPRADEILSDLIKPFDHNVFFQGDKDFAYDGDVVFHEFMHAITTSLVGKLNSLGLSPWGIHSEPGSLNEGWSDYFSAAFTEESSIGEYAAIKGMTGEVGLRNIDTDASCPQDVIGEIHHDSLVWSSALWQIRSQIKNTLGEEAKKEFDRAVLASLSKSVSSENFKTQSEKLLSTIEQNLALGTQGAKIAKNILEKKGLKDCFRAFSLSLVDDNNKLLKQVKDQLYVPSKNQIGLKNYAPSSSQLGIAVPAGASSYTLSWKQFLGGTGALLGTESTPDSTANIIPLGVVVSEDTPIVWKFEKAHSIPYRGSEVIKDIEQAKYSNRNWYFNKALNLNRCEQKMLYVSLLSNDFKYVLENIKVDFQMKNNDDLSDCDFSISAPDFSNPDSGCQSANTSLSFLLLMLALLRLRNNFKL